LGPAFVSVPGFVMEGGVGRFPEYTGGDTGAQGYAKPDDDFTK